MEGATTKAIFEAYAQEILAPTPKARQIVVMDNLSSHKGQRVEELIEERGRGLVYLPPRSPDLDPIEEAFAELEGISRKAQACSCGAPVEAIGAALLPAISTHDARGFFEHRSYNLLAQPL